MNKIIERRQKKQQSEGWLWRGAATMLQYFRALNFFGFIQKDHVISKIPFILFLVMLALLLIANSYYTERIIRQIDKTTYEIKELQTEFITGRSELMFNTNQSQVAALLDSIGLKISRTAPYKITVHTSLTNEKRHE
jgi:hypothetical protein